MKTYSIDVRLTVKADSYGGVVGSVQDLARRIKHKPILPIEVASIDIGGMKEVKTD